MVLVPAISTLLEAFRLCQRAAIAAARVYCGIAQNNAATPSHR
jgi:hypothetical protein